MSLAQRAEPQSTAPVEAAALLDAATLKVNAPIDFRQLLRRTSGPKPVLAPVPASGVATLEHVPPLPPAPMPEPAARTSPDVALDLLGEVSRAMTTLMARCQELEAGAEVAKQQAAEEIAAATSAAQGWHQCAKDYEQKVGQLEAALGDLQRRLDASEAQVVSVQAVADRSQHAAAEAECLASLFQEKVISSFGLGSSGHSILESVRARTQSMLTA